MIKRKMLLVSAISPFPQDSGGATRMKNTIKELSKYFEIYLISFKNINFNLTKEEESLLNIWCKKIYFVDIKPNENFSFINTGQPYWFSPWYSTDLIYLANKIINENKIDILQVEFSQLLYLIDYISNKNKLETIFTAHDISTISFWRRLKELDSIKKRVVHYLRYLEIYSYEKEYLPKYNQINSVSEKDKLSIEKMFDVRKVINVPNGIEQVRFIKPRKKINSIKLGYIGSFDHTPNFNAVKYFFKVIAPLLKKQNITYKFYLAGKNDSEFTKNAFPKIFNLGLVKNTLDFYRKIDCLVTPIFSGSGSRIKILESLSFGIPVVSSPIGTEGIRIKSDFIKVANTPQQYVTFIKKIILMNRNNQSKLEEDLQPLLWENIFKSYQNLIN